MPLTIAAMSVYNYEQSIAKTVLGCKKYVDKVIVIDEGSSDATAEIAAALGAEVVRHEASKAYGAALCSCFDAARQIGAERLVIIDTEVQQDITELLAGLQEGNDAVLPDNLRGCGAYGRRAIEAIQINGDNGSAISEIRAQIQHLKVTSLPSSRELRYRRKLIAVVVPAYNEEKLIGKTLCGIPDYVARIYAVDDGSPDRTGDIINECAWRDPRIVPIHHNPNRGPGAAIISGYSLALADGMDIIATMDGDGQMDPHYLPQFLDPIVDCKCDFTLGNRLSSPQYRGRMSKWRFFGNAILTFLTKVASGYWSMTDPQNGYTAISRRALEVIGFEGMYPRYGYLNDRLVRLNIHGFRIRNIPHPAKYGNEKSSIKYGSYIVRVSNLLLRDFLWRLKMKYVVFSFHPLVIFYLFGSVLTAIGLAAGCIALWEKLVWGYPFLFVHGTLSMLVFILGTMFLSFAMLFDMFQERQNSGWY